MLVRSYGPQRPQRPKRIKPVRPKELNASWLLRPPFTTNSGENASEVKGMFHYVFDLALNKCCAKLNAGTKTRINFKTQALNRSQLHSLLLNDSVHLILPVQSDEDKIYKKNPAFHQNFGFSWSRPHPKIGIGKFGMPLAALSPSLPWQFCCRL